MRSGTKIRIYKINDFYGDPVEGSWYSEELHQISDIQHRIERVLKRRTFAHGTRKLYVKWRDWLEKFNSLIAESTKYDFRRR